MEIDLDKLSNDYGQFNLKGRITHLLARGRMHFKSNRVHIVTEESVPLLFHAFEHARKKLGIRKQLHLVLYDSDDINGFYADGNCVFISAAAVKRLADPQVLSIIAHELGHQRSSRRMFLERAAIATTTICMLPGAKKEAGKALDQAVEYPASETITARLAGNFLAAWFMLELLQISGMMEEYRADRASSEVVGARQAIRLFEMFESEAKNSGGIRSGKESGYATQLAGALFSHLIDPHPSFTRRITALKKVEEGEERAK